MCEVTLKRKRTLSSSDVVDDDETNGVSSSQGVYDEQQLRRRVFELSLDKVRMAAPLTRSLRRREPPLLRSVLILNTLRTVDPTGIFSNVDPTLSAAAAVVPATPCRSPSALDELPGLLMFDDGRALATATVTDDLGLCDALTYRRPADDATSSSILDDLFGCERTSVATPSPPVLTFSSLFDLDCSSVWPSTSVALMSNVTSSSSSSSPWMDVDMDLDVTMFDFDLLQPLTAAAAGCAGSRAAVCSTAAGLTSVCGGGGVLATQRGQLFVDELDRIAQILVGT